MEGWGKEKQIQMKRRELHEWEKRKSEKIDSTGSKKIGIEKPPALKELITMFERGTKAFLIKE